MTTRRTGGLHTADNPNGQRIAWLRADLLLNGAVRALRDAIGEGVPVRRLATLATIRASTPASLLDMEAAQLRDLDNELKAAKRRARRAEQYAIDSEDDEEARRWLAESRRARSEERSICEKIHAANSRDSERVPESSLHAETKLLGDALSRLATCGNRMTQDEIQALEFVMPTFSALPDESGQWWATASIRLVLTDGIAELGPIRWPLGGRGFGTSTVSASIAQPTVVGEDGQSRAVLKEKLVQAGIRVAARRLLLAAPFPQLPHVVLFGKAGVPFPEWVGEQWRQDPFVRWITDVYTGAIPSRLAKNYAHASPIRQAVADTVAEHGGKMTVAELQAALPPISVRYLLTMKGHERGRYGGPGWQPVVLAGEDARKTEVRARTFRSVPCPCGGLATIAARVPEVPRHLLCKCGRMADAADHGMSDDVRFPDEYLALAMSPQRWRSALEGSKIGGRRYPMSAERKAVLAAVPPAPGTTSAKAIAAATEKPLDEVRRILYSLEHSAYVRRVGDRRPLNWQATPKVPDL